MTRPQALGNFFYILFAQFDGKIIMEVPPKPRNLGGEREGGGFVETKRRHFEKHMQNIGKILCAANVHLRKAILSR